MSQKLKIKLLPNGEVQMETLGIKGKKCLDYAKFIKDVVGGEIVKKTITAEYYETETEIIETDNAEISLD